MAQLRTLYSFHQATHVLKDSHPFGMHVKHFAPRPNILWSVRHWVYEALADFLNSNKGLSINFLYLYTSFFASIITFFKAKKTIYIDPTQCL